MKKILSLMLVLILVLCCAAFAEDAGYEETVVTIAGADYDIPATVCMPTGEGPFPAVVMLHGTGSNRGTGGMITKIQASEFATSKGIECVIMNGENPKRLYDLMEGKAVGTRFIAKN